MDLALEGRGLAGQLLGVVVLGERNLDGLLVAGLRADELILEAGDERAGAEVEVVLLRLAALKRLAVDKALEVDGDGVAVLRFALDGLDAGVALGHTVQLGVDVGLTDGHGLLRDLDALVFAEGDLRIERGGNGQGNIALFRGVHIDNRRRADGLQALLGDGLLIDLRENFVDGIFIEHRGAVHALDHLARGLALAEAGDHDVLAALGIRLVQGHFKLRLFDLDGDLGITVFFFYALDIHVGFSSYAVRPRGRISPK